MTEWQQCIKHSNSHSALYVSMIERPTVSTRVIFTARSRRAFHTVLQWFAEISFTTNDDQLSNECAPCWRLSW